MSYFHLLLNQSLDCALQRTKTRVIQNRYRRAAEAISKAAETLGVIGRPNQQFYNALETTVAEVPIESVRHLVRIMDDRLGTCCTWPDGSNINPLPMPSSADAAKVMSRYSFPVISCPLPHLLVWSFDLYELGSGLCENALSVTRGCAMELYSDGARAGHALFSPQVMDEWSRSIEKSLSDGAITKRKFLFYQRAIEIICCAARCGTYKKRSRKKNEVSESFKRSSCYLSVAIVVEQLKPTISSNYWVRISTVAGELLSYAENHGLFELSQQLFEGFYRDVISVKRHDYFDAAIKLLRAVDAKFSLGAVHPVNGLLLNELVIDDDMAAKATGLTLEEKHSCPIETVIAQAKTAVTQLGLSDSTIGQYTRAWRLFAGFALPRYGRNYCHAAVDEYRDDVERRFNNGELNEWKRKQYRRAALVLKEVAENDGFTWKYFQFARPRLAPEAEQIRTALLQELGLKKLSEARIEFYGYVVRQFFLCSGITTKGELALMGEDTVVKVSSHFKDCCCNSSLGNITSSLRSWYEWLFKTGYVARDFCRLIVSEHHLNNRVVPYFSEEDEFKIRKALPDLDDRNRAIILLALDLGLRNSDILNLRLSNIDWKHEQLSIVQHKTGVPITCPLLEEVGNALFDYLTKVRPEKAEGDFVFVRKHAPFNHFGHAYDQVAALCKKLGVKPQNGHGIGPHTLRHTFTRRLLSSGKVPHQSVTAVLGHKTNSADRHYRSMEDERLMECALDLSEIGSYSWEG